MDKKDFCKLIKSVKTRTALLKIRQIRLKRHVRIISIIYIFQLFDRVEINKNFHQIFDFLEFFRKLAIRHLKQFWTQFDRDVVVKCGQKWAFLGSLTFFKTLRSFTSLNEIKRKKTTFI